jgi:hypothetical protein
MRCHRIFLEMAKKNCSFCNLITEIEPKVNEKSSKFVSTLNAAMVTIFVQQLKWFLFLFNMCTDEILVIKSALKVVT